MVGLRQARSLMMHKREIELLAMTKKMKEGWITKIKAFHVLREYRAATLLVDATYIALSQRLALQRLIRLEALVLESWSHHRYALKTRRSRLSFRIRVRHWRLLSRMFEAYQLQTRMHQLQRLRLQTWAHKRSFKTSSRSFGILRKYAHAHKQQIKLLWIVETRHRTRLEHVIFDNWAHVAHARKSRNRRLGNAHIKRCLTSCVPYFEKWMAFMHHRRLKARSLPRLVRTRGLKLSAQVFTVWRYSKEEQHYNTANITRYGDRRQHRLLVAVIRTLWQMAAINVQVRRLLTRRARRNMIKSLHVLRNCLHVKRRLNQTFARRLLRHKRRTLHALSRYVIDKRRLIRISGRKERHLQLNVLNFLHQYVHMRNQMRRLLLAYVFCVQPVLLTGMRALEHEASANSWARAAEKLVLLRCRRERWLKRWVILVFRDQQLRNRHMASCGVVIDRKLKPFLQLVFMAWRQRRSGTDIQFSFQLSRFKTFSRRAALVFRAFDMLALYRLRRQRKARRGCVDWAHARYWRMMLHTCFFHFVANLEIVHTANQRVSLRQAGDKRNAFQVWGIKFHRLKHQQRVIRRVRAAVNTLLVRNVWRKWYRARARKKRHKHLLSRLHAVVMRNERRTMCHVLDILYARTHIVRGRTRANQQMVARRLELLSAIWVYWLSVKVLRRRFVNIVNRTGRSEMRRGWYSWVYFIRCQCMVKRLRHSRCRKLLRLSFNLLLCERCDLEGRLRDTVQKTEQRLNDPAREIEEGSVDIAKIRMRHAELHGRVGEGDAAAAALEEEKTEHSETQRDAMSMLDRAPGQQRELMQARTRAEEQHSMDAQELKLEHEIMDLNAEHTRELDRTCSDRQRAAQQEKEGYVSERQEAERKHAAAHRAELDNLEQTLRAQDDGEVENLRALLREEEHKSDTRVAALEEETRETLARAENTWRSNMQALDADCKVKVDKALAEAAQRKGLVATLEKVVSDVKFAAQLEVQRVQGELEKEISTLRAQHIDELVQMRHALAQARCDAKAEQVKANALQKPKP